MHKLKFSEIFSQRRKLLRLTQNDVAAFIGVTNAAVSKWEQGTSYPELTILPKLATLLNLTIDELLGYDPQLTRTRIQELYTKYANRLSEEPFEVVQADIEAMISEYYSCYPFIVNMCQLYLNYFVKAQQPDLVMKRITALCKRVITNSDDFKVINDARMLQAGTYLVMNEPEQLLNYLGEEVLVEYGVDQLIATAYSMLGETTKAKATLQASVYQSSMFILSNLTEILMLEMDRPNYFDAMIERAIGLINLFNLYKLNPNLTLIFYYKAAVGYTKQERNDKALEMLHAYYKATNEMQFPYVLKGDEYFYLIDDWMKNNSELSSNQPRDEQSIKHDMVHVIADKTIFGPLQDDAQYQAIVTNLKHKLRIQ